LLCTCSDRALRLYYLDLAQFSKKENNLLSKVIYLKNEIKDVINGRKWQNSAFIKLNPNTMIVDQSNFDYEKLESRGTTGGSGAGSCAYYGGQPLKVGSAY
jgi:hypothetical protein